MTRLLRHAILFSVVLGLACCWSVAEEGLPLEATVDVEQFDGWSRTSVTIPGKLVSYALPRIVDGTREIALLVAPRDDSGTPEDRPSDDEQGDTPEPLPACPADEDQSDLVLVRLTRDPGRPPVRVREGLPPDLEALDAADLDGDGADELLLAREQELLVVGPQGERRVVTDPGLVWSSLHPRATEQPELDGRPLVTTTPLGELLLFGAGEEDGAWSRLATVEIPLKGHVHTHGINVFNSVPRFVGMREDETLLFTTRPEPYGSQRLQIQLIEIAPSGTASITDCWVRLPQPEDVLEEDFLIIDGQVMLLVTTKPANKLSIFGEKRLRLFPLQRDRSRLGKPPVYVAESRMNMWQEGEPLLLDVNADGRRDLVIGYWKGLKDDRVVLDAYLRQDEGWFADTPKTTAFDVEPAKHRSDPDSKPERPDPDRSFVNYGRDLDGDSLPDLLLRTSVSLLVYRGRASSNGLKLVDKQPLELPLSVETETGDYYVSIGPDHFDTRSTGNPGRPRLADLDGDGAAEILIVIRGVAPGQDLLQIIDLAPCCAGP